MTHKNETDKNVPKNETHNYFSQKEIHKIRLTKLDSQKCFTKRNS